MKSKLYLTLLLAAALQTATAEPIDRASARMIAQRVTTINDNASDNVKQAPFYVFSRGAGQGYVIISGDDSTTPVIGYTEQGDYDEATLPDPLKDMLKTWSSRIRQIQARQGKALKVRRLTTARVDQILRVDSWKSGWTSVSPLCQTHWHQSAPYNIFTPNRSDNGQKTMVGCEATAAAQILYYFRKDNPDHLLYDTPTYNESWFHAPVTLSLPKGTPVNYGIMKLSGSGTAMQDTAVAVLCYAVGTGAHLGYGYQDGTATAGSTDNMGNCLSYYFNLSNDCVWKSGTQQSWETTIYNNLVSGRPMLYSGSNEQQGGHAVVLDGYQASTGLFHFNFGWGGQGDGYYTVNDQTGMNGFNSGQQMLVNITPKKQNIKARLEQPVFYQGVESNIHARVYNQSTLSYKGIRLYVSGTKKLPSSPTVTNQSVTLQPGDSCNMAFYYRPTASHILYVFVTDLKGNILDSLHVTPLETKAELSLQKFAVDKGSETVKKGDYNFGIVNNTTATISATLNNSANGTVCEPTIKCQLDTLNQQTGNWEKAQVRVMAKLIFNSDDTRDTTFVFSDLDPDRYYRATMDHEVKATETSELAISTPDSILYFTVRKPNLAMTVNGRTATVEGNWNSNLFSDMASDEGVTSYDLTGVKDLTTEPAPANPNAIFYVNKAVSDARNMVVNGVCNNLVISTSHEFLPSKGFTARKAVLLLDSAAGGRWGDVVVPFKVDVPYGMQARVLDTKEGHKLTWKNVTSAEAMTPLLYLPDRDGLNSLEASDVAISTDSVAVANDGLWTGLTVTDHAVKATMVLGIKSTLPTYLMTEDTVDVAPFRTQVTDVYRFGYRIYNDKPSINLDRNYKMLADTICLAYAVIDQYGDAAQTFLADTLTKAEDMFTNFSTEDYNVVKEMHRSLGDQIRLFLNGSTDGIKSVVITVPDTDYSNDPVEYYSLDGRRLAAPAPGIVIVKQGSKVWKRVIR